MEEEISVVYPLPHPLVTLLVFLFLILVPVVRLLRRAGIVQLGPFSFVFPGLNLIAFWYFAFKPWPTDTKSPDSKY